MTGNEKVLVIRVSQARNAMKYSSHNTYSKLAPQLEQ